ncbi:hypothetical protein NKR23_g8378 [Pleurostoma richardsiae]|uniref:Uncharacterized protein n=1 Tax=Pleurostoma richardsiae TaxID=41990 RepID=A0AA38R9G2_9PEZI|nr:hypothetical protein NKR23_g8378 [Pleurostoma richardsiae]
MEDTRIPWLRQRSRLMDEALSSSSEDITPDQAKALAHWSMFGRQVGVPSQTRVIRSAWMSKKENEGDTVERGTSGDGSKDRFLAPSHAAWHVPLSAAQLAVVLNGFRPRGMEDKYFVYAEGPDAEGGARLWLRRSWTGYPSLLLDLQVVVEDDEDDDEDDDDNEAEETHLASAGKGKGTEVREPWSGEITGLTWETSEERNKEGTEEMAKFEALEGIHWIFGVKLVDGEIPQPSSWDNLPLKLPRTQEKQTTYKGMSVSAETMARWKPGMILTFD